MKVHFGTEAHTGEVVVDVGGDVVVGDEDQKVVVVADSLGFVQAEDS